MATCPEAVRGTDSGDFALCEASDCNFAAMLLKEEDKMCGDYYTLEYTGVQLHLNVLIVSQRMKILTYPE